MTADTTTTERKRAAPKLVWGRAANGRLVHISDVVNGLKCGCECPACDQRLIAKKGEEIRHHYAHSLTSECSNAPSLARIVLTLLARKSIAIEPVSLQLPAQWAGEEEVAPAQSFNTARIADKAEAYQELPVDLILDNGEQHLGIVLSRDLSPEEVEQLRHAGLPTVRYDLTQHLPLDARIEDVRQVLESAERSKDGQWLYSRLSEERLEQHLRDLEAQQAEAQAKAAAARCYTYAKVGNHDSLHPLKNAISDHLETWLAPAVGDALPMNATARDLWMREAWHAGYYRLARDAGASQCKEASSLTPSMMKLVEEGALAKLQTLARKQGYLHEYANLEASLSA